MTRQETPEITLGDNHPRTSLSGLHRWQLRSYKLLRLIALMVGLAASSARAGDIDFGRDIRPILSDRCFKCHGQDRAGAENDLRLDIRAKAINSSIVPGKPEESELIARITSDDPDRKMPPAGSERKPLSPSEIAVLKRWIHEGAPYSDHWAYAAPQKSPPPKVKDAPWPANEIDQFTLAGMERGGIAPAPEADRRTLIRRLSFDLLGLPPSSDDVQNFLEDSTAGAYESLVERLLSSPHYGERMAIGWLDLVRYADTAGYHSDNPRHVDAFRDYVIDSFNRNKPFDQFTIEQIAGDLLPNSTTEQRVGSAYNRLLQTTGEGGAQAKEYIAIYQADRVRNVSSVWMASTMGCCQCHDHKFDPLSARDFYSLAAFFADIEEQAVGIQTPNILLPTPEQSARLSELEAQFAAVKSRIDYDGELEQWALTQRKKLDAPATPVTAIIPASARSRDGATLKILNDASVLASGEDPDRDVYTVSLPAPLPLITGFRLEAITHPELKSGGLSRESGNFLLTGVEVLIRRGNVETPVKIASAHADFEQGGFPVAHTLDGDPATGWSVLGQIRKQDCTALFVFEQPIPGAADAELVVVLRHESAQAKHSIGCFRIALATTERPALEGTAGVVPDLQAALRKGRGERSKKDGELLEKNFRQFGDAAASIRPELDRIEKSINGVKSRIRTCLVAESRAEPRDVRILARGNWQDDSGPIVQPAVPERFGSLHISDRRPTRLDLAQWLVRKDHPLTSRVVVNRTWSHFFGWGIARSLEDFGYQGDWPTHPELLDWLAIDFVEHGWDVKRLAKQIVMSRTYRQSSQTSPENRQRDPLNRLLARQGVVRLNAEMVRDNALSVSGLLVPHIGGASVKPYQPAGYWQHLNFPPRDWEADKGANQYRRGLYTFWCRSFLHPSMLAFDATSREECMSERPRSNTPLQALVLLNDPTYMEAARALAERTASRPGNDRARLTWAYQQVLQREPTDSEAVLLAELLSSERRRSAAASDKRAAENKSPSSGTPASELAGWTAVCRTLLNLHESITRY